MNPPTILFILLSGASMVAAICCYQPQVAKEKEPEKTKQPILASYPPPKNHSLKLVHEIGTRNGIPYDSYFLWEYVSEPGWTVNRSFSSKEAADFQFQWVSDVYLGNNKVDKSEIVRELP